MRAEPFIIIREYAWSYIVSHGNIAHSPSCSTLIIFTSLYWILSQFLPFDFLLIVYSMLLNLFHIIYRSQNASLHYYLLSFLRVFMDLVSWHSKRSCCSSGSFLSQFWRFTLYGFIILLRGRVFFYFLGKWAIYQPFDIIPIFNTAGFYSFLWQCDLLWLDIFSSWFFFFFHILSFSLFL